jgi:hypothetical protein
MNWNPPRFSVSALSSLIIGFVLLTVPFWIPSTASIMGLIDWPGAVGFSILGVGIISIGVIYLGSGITGILLGWRTEHRFSRVFAVGLLGFPLLIMTYWTYGQLGTALQPGWELSRYEWDFVAISACSYFPIALGFALGFVQRPRHELVVFVLAMCSVGVPATFWVLVADWAFLAPLFWVATLVYDGIVAYPLYRFAKRINTTAIPT